MVEHHADPVPVARGGGRRVGRLLRRHVRRRPDDLSLVQRRSLAGQRGHHPEVEDHHAARRGDDHVRRLDVLVQVAALVKRHDAGDQLAQPVSQPPDACPAERRHGGDHARRRRCATAGPPAIDHRLHGAVDRLGRRAIPRRPAAHVAEEVDPVHQLHGEEPLVVVEEQLVQRDQVGMRHVGQGAELLLEAEDALRAGAGQRLERDLRSPLAIERPIHDSHAARPDPFEQLEACVAAERPRPRVRAVAHATSLTPGRIAPRRPPCSTCSAPTAPARRRCAHADSNLRSRRRANASRRFPSRTPTSCGCSPTSTTPGRRRGRIPQGRPVHRRR